MTTPIDATRLISGNYVFVYDENGRWLANVKAFSAGADINMEDVPRAGTRSIGKKATTVDRSGSMTADKVSSYFQQLLLGSIRDKSRTFVTELNVKIEDPDNGGVERWRFKGVQFTNIPMVNSEVGSLIEEELNFVYDSEELVEVIED